MSGSITGTTATGTTATTPGTLSGDTKMFLTLLATQLKAQDPSAPLDANQLTQQLVQFASVEQQVSQTQALNRLIELQQSAQLTSAAPLLGSEVEVESDRLSLQEGEAAIMLPAASGTTRSAIVTVSDSSGHALAQEEVALGAAPRRWDWAPAELPDGAYGVTVKGVKDGGETEQLGFTVLGKVTGASVGSDGTAQLRLGGLAVAFAKLRALGAGVS